MNEHSNFQIKLTDDEKDLYVYLKNFTEPSKKNYQEKQKRRDKALELTNSLINRNAIPKIRLEYFCDPKYYINSSKSRKKEFEDNETKGEDIFRHYHFQEILFYFIDGPELPSEIIDGFNRIYEDSEPITSGDIVVFGKFAREQTKAHNLNHSNSAEEFYKLSLEFEFEEYEARFIRDYVKRP